LTGQNTSTAVMQRRRVAPDSLDYFPTPPFATRALCRFLHELGYAIEEQEAWEPACGEMHMVRPLREFFAAVRASDVHRYGEDHALLDFTVTGQFEPRTDWAISNPPFVLAEAFIRTGLAVARVGVAMLLRGAFLEGQERYNGLFSDHPPDYVLQFAERVCMLEGRLVQIGTPDPFSADQDGKLKKASTATSYCWFVWLTDGTGDTRLRWIPPCRLLLERAGDYPDYAVAAAGATRGPLL
jgi:hypothetical protein